MSEEMWHVQIEPGDVKTVTLEQLDDMFRLDLISASTLVWQPGMPKALPLSVVAGIEDDEDEEVMEIEPELIPEPAVPAAAQYVAPRQHTITPPPAISAPPPALNAPSAYPPPTTNAPSAYPPPATNASSASPPPAPAMPTPDFYSPESLRPITMSDIPSFRPRQSGRGGKVLMGVAIAAGLLLTLYRNDLLRPMAESAGSVDAYEEIESAFGSPGFGTTRSVSQLSAMLNPPPAVSDASGEANSTVVSDASENGSTQADDSSTNDSNSASASDHAREPNEAKQDAKQDATKTAPSKASPAPRHHAPAPRKARSAPKKKLKSFKSSEYDPMNAKL